MGKASGGRKVELKTVPPEFRFMFRKLPLRQYDIVYWLSIPEFLNKMTEMKVNNTTIDANSVLPIMEQIYEDYANATRAGETVRFEFRHSRVSINRLRRFIEEQSNTDA